MKKLAKLCQKIGALTPEWIQGTGGNISYKTAEWIYIKASGKRLDQVTELDGLVKVQLRPFREKMAGLDSDNKYQLALAAIPGRPSMELGFHALLPGTWVIHAHSLTAIIMADIWRESPPKMLAWLKKFPLTVEKISLANPGWELATKLSSSPNCDVYLIENHGMVLQGANPGIVEAWRSIEEDFCREFGYLIGADFFAPAPLRFVFPDMAVAEPKLKKVATPTKDGLFEFPENCRLKERNLAEIFQASSILHRLRPGLPSLPEEYVRQLNISPAEIFRKEQI